VSLSDADAAAVVYRMLENVCNFLVAIDELYTTRQKDSI